VAEHTVTYRPTEGVCTFVLQKQIADRISENPYTTQSLASLAEDLIDLVRAAPRIFTSCACETEAAATFTMKCSDRAGRTAASCGTQLECVECGRIWVRTYVEEEYIPCGGWWTRTLSASNQPAKVVDLNARHAAAVVFGGDYSDIDNCLSLYG